MIKDLPKIELHCHLDGSVRVETIIDIAKKDNIKMSSYKFDDIKKIVQVNENCSSLNEYLEKFHITNKVMQTKESLERITYELLEDASKENIKYMEIRFAPQLHTKNNLTYKEIIQSVLKGIEKAENRYEIRANIILSCMRNMSEESAIEVIEQGKEFLNKGVVAIDLAGPEEEGFSNKFKNATDLAREYGYKITIHAGEQASANNVIDAINLLGATRIGHGIKIENLKQAYDLVKEKEVMLEMCPTSNIHTKNVENISKYPLYKFYKDNIKISFNTDNRTVSNVDLSNEIDIILKEFDISVEDYKKIYLDTIDKCFCDEETKKWLRKFI